MFGAQSVSYEISVSDCSNKLLFSYLLSFDIYPNLFKQDPYLKIMNKGKIIRGLMYAIPLEGPERYRQQYIEDDYEDSLLFDKKFPAKARITYALMLGTQTALSIAAATGLASLINN